MLSSVVSNDSVFVTSCGGQGRPQPPPSATPGAQRPNTAACCSCSSLVFGDQIRSRPEKSKSKFKSPKAAGGLKTGASVSVKTESSPNDEAKLSLATFSTKLTNTLSNAQVNRMRF